MTVPLLFNVISEVPLDSAGSILVRGVLRPLLLISFEPRNLDDPAASPIGVFFQDGIRKYLWRDKYWGEYQSANEVMTAVATELRTVVDVKRALHLRLTLDILKSYKTFAGFGGSVTHRIIYEIDG